MNNKKIVSFCAASACAALMIPALSAHAAPAPVSQDSTSGETRVGAVLQIPFNLEGAGFNFAKLRLGVVCQVAEVEDESFFEDGDRSYGAELGAYVEPLGGWNISGEVSAFYGTNDIQGAVGVGYDMANGIFANVKLMAPYSEIGVRFLGPLEIYGGMRTLGDFDPDSVRRPERR